VNEFSDGKAVEALPPPPEDVVAQIPGGAAALKPGTGPMTEMKQGE